ncbi:peptidyl-prolyl cis-trans isomerase sig-7 [Cylas formicarius]|uniref:peptidyl-prolyl cis-trans isomerase sig-7 n=1 Tax=Cylas formicarius TaxID=197179 RepID=UPI00295849BC|nr:peptidyl-prolyl cis-trans isomerase sig-7 [Cylas formicarius]
MSVVIETTLGDLTVDLFLNERPRACLNFLKLCSIKYYNYNLFHTISRGFIAQSGDPTGSRTGGESIFGILNGPSKRYFEAENEPRIKHTKLGLISFVGAEDNMIGSQFFITLGENLAYLDDKHCVFGEIVEGFDVLEILNEVICDNDDRPYQDVRITHTVVLDDPYPNPKGLLVPSRSPSPSAERLQGGRIAPDEEIDEISGKTAKEIAEMQAEREAKARATILEMVGDIPDAEIAPPENVLFVCKLNPVTTDDDLEIIFSRFGKIKSCEVIRDKKTGDSLQYAFIEFENQKACEDAYFKMDNVLIDDRRIHVDFSQSVSKVKWLGKGRVSYYDDTGKKQTNGNQDIGKGNYRVKSGRRSRSPKDNRRKSPQRLRSPRRRSKSPRRRSKSPRRRSRSPWKRSRSPHLQSLKKSERSLRKSRSPKMRTPDTARSRSDKKDKSQNHKDREHKYHMEDKKRDRQERKHKEFRSKIVNRETQKRSEKKHLVSDSDSELDSKSYKKRHKTKKSKDKKKHRSSSSSSC